VIDRLFYATVVLNKDKPFAQLAASCNRSFSGFGLLAVVLPSDPVQRARDGSDERVLLPERRNEG
jgi:hypothetical protein